jgi:hypothetical protein
MVDLLLCRLLCSAATTESSLSSFDIVKIVLGLGHAVAAGCRLIPILGNISSTLHVEFSVIFKDTCLLDVAFVVVLLLGDFFVTDLLVLDGSQTSGNIRSSSDLSSRQLREERGDREEKIKNKDEVVFPNKNSRDFHTERTFFLLRAP